MTQPLLHEEEYVGRLRLDVWREVLLRARPHWKMMGALVAVAAMTSILDAAMGLVTRQVVNDLELHGPQANLALWGAAYGGVAFGFGLCIWVFIRFGALITTGVAHDLRQSGFGKLQSLSFSYYDKRPVGWLMARLTSDSDRLSRLMAWGLLDLVWGVFLLASITVVMLAVNWRLALVVLAVMPPLAWVSFFFQGRILAASRKVRKINSEITHGYEEAINAVRTTKTLVRERQNLEEFRGRTSEMYAGSVRSEILSAVYLPAVITLGAAATGAALWYGGGEYVRGKILLGDLVLFLSYAGMIFMPVQELARVLSDLQSAQAAAERVVDLLKTEPEIKDSAEVVEAVRRHAAHGTACLAEAAEPRRVAAGACGNGDAFAAGAFGNGDAFAAGVSGNGEAFLGERLAPDGLTDRIDAVEFRDVSFAYKPGQSVLQNFSLRIEAGQTVALAGPTGGGKTTVASLLCRFYEPTSGQILLDGIDYRHRPLAWLQSKLGVVLQAPHLFSGTVRDNIRYGRLEASDAEVEAAARAAGAHEFILRLEKGYDADVGQRGNRLSVGQKQLVSLARAVLADPRIFILDEATSSVDAEVERAIQAGVERVLRGRISLVIAHRLSTIRSADRILVIDGGRIVEDGTHRQLIARRGRYHELYVSQFARQREDALLGAKGDGSPG